jgi:hypothetical protein
MTQAPKQSYRGVLCMSCRQPIPLPAIVMILGTLPQGSEAGPRPEHTERVFSLRCRACSRERPYRSADIIEFEGTPRSRFSHVRGPRGVRRQASNLSRAANG